MSATVVAALGIAGSLAACGGGTNSSSGTPAATSSSTSQASASLPTISSASAPTALASGGVGELRPGCGTYCQNAGGYGAPGEHGVEAVTIVSRGTVTLDPDGFLPLTLTCNLPVQCTGAILVCTGDGSKLSTMAMGCGRAEEMLDGGATQTVGVPLPTPALGFLQSRGLAAASVTVDNRGVPDCQQIPQLAAQCAKTVEALPADHPRGDGIIRGIGGRLTLAPAASGADSPGSEAASLGQLQQAAAADRGYVAAQLADHWVPQLSSKRPGVVDDGFTWDNTLTWQEFERLRQRYGGKLLWSGDWSTFEATDFWVTVAPITFDDARGALQWCSMQGFDADHCAATLVSATHPVAGSFAHN
ncbi:hypothetical protein H7K15_13520 [Mycobacterium parmense]|nr:hypothetical protein [Mycobacterium parmense]MCV7351141.1 hypothetical protein [Mycobacterium parmense]